MSATENDYYEEEIAPIWKQLEAQNKRLQSLLSGEISNDLLIDSNIIKSRWGLDIDLSEKNRINILPINHLITKPTVQSISNTTFLINQEINETELLDIGQVNSGAKHWGLCLNINRANNRIDLTELITGIANSDMHIYLNPNYPIKNGQIITLILRILGLIYIM